MTNENSRSFMLNNSLAAVSAVPLSETTLATDGIDSKIHIFNRNGTQNDCTETVRPYRRLRRNESNGNLTALSCCNERRIYFINPEYRELGYSELELNGECELSDASITVIGNEPFIVGATRSNAYLFDINGKMLEPLCEADRSEAITDFIRPRNNLYALATESNGSKIVTVYDGDNRFSAILSRGISLRMLIYKEPVILGLFGFGYIYNRIIPIYADGKLVLPDRNYSET